MFGTYLKRLRKYEGFTQRELAEECGINHTYISKIENGHDEAPSEEVLNKIATALSLPTFPRLEMIVAAGKIPTEFKELLMNDEEARKEMFRFLLRKEKYE